MNILLATIFQIAHVQNSKSKIDLPQRLKGILTKLRSELYAASDSAHI